MILRRKHNEAKPAQKTIITQDENLRKIRVVKLKAQNRMNEGEQVKHDSIV